MKTVAVALLLGLAAPAAAQSIQGRWKVVAAEDLRADGTVARLPWGKNPLGSIVVEGGSCYVQIMSGDVASFVPDKPVGDQMTAMLLSSYISYTGPCTINDAEG